ncbi:XTP/dITP diphosphatase [bacterium]|nr:XTP/dITP diphosphatase [bacterium]
MKPVKVILLATHNRDKVREISLKLNNYDITVKSLLDFPDAPEIVEDGDTLEANAVKKAEAGFKITGLPTIADDTGLEVKALIGAPGVYSSRYAGENVTYADNRRKLLHEMTNVPDNERSAVFRTVAAFKTAEYINIVEGQCEGYITREERGEGGFGYDPVFYIPDYKQTFAEMPLELKNKISHRGEAMDKIVEVIEKYFNKTSHP